MSAKSAVALLVILCFLGNTACSASSTEILDAAVAAADAAVAGLSAGGLVPAQDEAYVKAVLDALNFATQELASKRNPAQIAIDIANEFRNVELPELTGLTPQQITEMQALAAAVATFIEPFLVLAANPPGSPAITMYPVGFQLTWTQRLHLMLVRRHVSRLQQTVQTIQTD